MVSWAANIRQLYSRQVNNRRGRQFNQALPATGAKVRAQTRVNRRGREFEGMG